MKKRFSTEEVSKDVIKYFKEFLPEYEVKMVTHYREHPDDYYLYEVIAECISNGTYACWSCWNQITQSLNYGHYAYQTQDECIRELKEVLGVA